MMKPIIAAATLLAFTAPAFAEDTPPDGKAKTVAEKFAKLDANKDSALSLDEVKAHDASVTQADFDVFDADKNGTLSEAEFAKWVEATAKPAQ